MTGLDIREEPIRRECIRPGIAGRTVGHPVVLEVVKREKKRCSATGCNAFGSHALTNQSVDASEQRGRPSLAVTRNPLRLFHLGPRWNSNAEPERLNASPLDTAGLSLQETRLSRRDQYDRLILPQQLGVHSPKQAMNVFEDTCILMDRTWLWYEAMWQKAKTRRAPRPSNPNLI